MDATKAIQIAVARADLILCTIVYYGWIALAWALIVGVWVLWREVRKWRT